MHARLHPLCCFTFRYTDASVQWHERHWQLKEARAAEAEAAAAEQRQAQGRQAQGRRQQGGRQRTVGWVGTWLMSGMLNRRGGKEIVTIK